MPEPGQPPVATALTATQADSGRSSNSTAATADSDGISANGQRTRTRKLRRQAQLRKPIFGSICQPGSGKGTVSEEQGAGQVNKPLQQTANVDAQALTEAPQSAEDSRSRSLVSNANELKTMAGTASDLQRVQKRRRLFQVTADAGTVASSPRPEPAEITCDWRRTHCSREHRQWATPNVVGP